MGDLRAQVIAVKTGERRFLELVRAMAASRWPRRSRTSWTTRRRRRARARTIPDGTYEAESYMDDDGYNVGQRIPLKVRVIKKATR